jgi:hypothetical protein
MYVYSTRLLAAVRVGVHVVSVVIRTGSIFRIGVAREGVVGFSFRSEDQGTAWQSELIYILARCS